MPDTNAPRDACRPEHEADAASVMARVPDNADAAVAEAEAAWAALAELPRSFDDLGRHDVHRDKQRNQRMPASQKISSRDGGATNQSSTKPLPIARRRRRQPTR